MARSSELNWSALEAPSLADIETLAERALARLPKSFRDKCRDVVIKVAELAEDDVLENLGIESPFDLMGLFQGTGLAHGGGGGGTTAALPNMVFLYRRAILDYWAEHHETLGAVVTHVLVHEIGHHFGLSDDDMDNITRGARP
jgi:predicted Zn-dependent protease with MMP-like domain